MGAIKVDSVLEVGDEVGILRENDFWPVIDVQDLAQKTYNFRESGLEERLDRTLFTSYTDASTSATVAVQTTIFGVGVGSLVLPANWLVVGKSVQVKSHGYLQNNNAGNVIGIYVYSGATVLLSAVGIALTGILAVNTAVEFDLALMCRTVGIGGTVVLNGALKVAGVVVAPLLSAVPIALDTTISNTLDIQLTYSANPSGTDTIVMQQGYVTAKN